MERYRPYSDVQIDNKNIIIIARLTITRWIPRCVSPRELNSDDDQALFSRQKEHSTIRWMIKKFFQTKNSSKQFFLRYFYEQWRQFIRRLEYTHLVRDENFRLFVIYLRKIGKKRKTEYLRIHKRIKRNRRRQERRKEGRDGRTDGAVTSRNRVDPVGRLAKLEGHCELSLILELVTAR